MIKTLVISFPPLDTRRPPIGSAIVANIFHSQGHNVSTVDLQFELNQWMIAKNISEHYFSDVFFESGASFNSDQISVLEEFIKSEIDRLKVSEFDYIACSFFSYLAQKFGKLFLKQLRKHTTAKVIIGGSG